MMPGKPLFQKAWAKGGFARQDSHFAVLFPTIQAQPGPVSSLSSFAATSGFHGAARNEVPVMMARSVKGDTASPWSKEADTEIGYSKS